MVRFDPETSVLDKKDASNCPQSAYKGIQAPVKNETSHRHQHLALWMVPWCISYHSIESVEPGDGQLVVLMGEMISVLPGGKLFLKYMYITMYKHR